MRLELDQLPVNVALLSLVGAGTNVEEGDLPPPPPVPPTHTRKYFIAVKCIKDLALFLKPFSGKCVQRSSGGVRGWGVGGRDGLAGWVVGLIAELKIFEICTMCAWIICVYMAELCLGYIY